MGQIGFKKRFIAKLFIKDFESWEIAKFIMGSEEFVQCNSKYGLANAVFYESIAQMTYGADGKVNRYFWGYCFQLIRASLQAVFHLLRG
jgi:hypothetical protein